MALSIGELVGYIDLDTSAAEGAVGKMEGVLSGVGGKWGAILGGAGAGAGLAFAGSLMGAVDNEVGSDRLAASLGKGSDAAERYGKVAGEVFANGFGAGLEDVNTAMGAVITSIKGMRGASDAEVQKMTEKAMTFADVMQVDVTRAAQVAGNMVYNGMAKDGAEAFDLLMKASQKVPVQLREDVLDATDEYGQFFTALGIDGPEAMALLAKGAEKGMYGIDKAGDAIKEFTIRATDGSKATLTTFEAIGLNGMKMSNDLLAGGDKAERAFNKTVDALLKVENPTQRAAEALALFGTPLEDLGTKDIPGFLKSLKTGEGGLGNFKGAVDKAGATAYDNAAGNLTMFKRTLQTGFVDMIGGKVLPKVTEWSGALNNNLGPAVSTVGDTVKRVTGWLREHSTVAGVLAGVIVGLAVVTAAHAAVMAVGAAGGMTAWLAGTKLISGATKVWTAVQWAINAALVANPIGLVVAAVVALIAIVVLIATKTTWFQDLWDKAWGAIQGAASAVFNWVKSNWPLILAVLTGPIGMAVLAIAKNWDKIKDGASNVKGWITDKFDALVSFFGGLPGRAANSLSSLTSTIRELFRDAMDAGKEKVTGIGDTIVTWIEGIPGKLLDKLSGFKSAGANLMQGFVDGMKNAAGVIEGIAGNVWDAVKGLLNGALDKVDNALTFTINLPGPKDISFNPDIPRLATGGRATAETLAVIGEGREPESVLPDSVLRGLLERAHAAGAASAHSGDGRNAPLIGQVVASQGMSADELAERLWFKTRTRG